MVDDSAYSFGRWWISVIIYIKMIFCPSSVKKKKIAIFGI